MTPASPTPAPLPAPPRLTRQATGRGRPLAPEVVEAVRVLVEGGTLPMRVVAAQVGVSRPTVVKLTARHGWRRPRPARMSAEGRRGGGAAIVPEVVAAARALIEGTSLSYKAVAERTGVSTTALCRWRKRGRWQRPPADDTVQVRPARYRRRRGRPYAADAIGAVRKLVTTTLLSQKAIARQVGISQERVSAWMRKRGWTRPSPTRPECWPARLAPSGGPNAGRSRFRGATRFAASQRKGPLEEAGDRRGRPYAAASRREARALWELTRLSTALIGARVGAHPATVSRWAKEESWERPHGRAGASQLRGLFGSRKARAG